MESASEESLNTLHSALSQQGAVLDQHSTLLASASHDFQLLSGRLTELSDRLEQVNLSVREHQLPSPSETSPSTDREPHTATPPTYDGDPNTCRAFLAQCSLVFALQPRRFASQTSRVAFVLTLLTGRARDWGMAVWEAQAPCTTTFETLKEEMVRLFDRSLQGDMAAAELVRLLQRGSTVTDYAISFKTLAATCGWNDAALRVQFLEGLDAHIQDEVAAQDLPTSLESAIDLALRIETRHRQRSLRRSFRQAILSPPEAPVTSSSLESEGEPMQLGRLRLTSSERQRRLSNGLCLYCGKAGHMVISCPVKGVARR